MDVASITGLQALALRQARGLWVQLPNLPAWDDLRRELDRQPPDHDRGGHRAQSWQQAGATLSTLNRGTPSNSPFRAEPAAGVVVPASTGVP